MLAARVREWGSLPVLEEVADPEPRLGHALVRVAAAAVGHVDRDIMRGGFFRHPPLPYIPGVEGAGYIVQSERVPVDAPVWFRGAGLGTAQDGTWAEMTLVREPALMEVPVGVELPVAACFFSPATSAYIALHDVGDVGLDDRVAVRGAGGAVGSLAVQLARKAGAARVVGLVSTRARADSVADGVEVIVASGADIATELQARMKGVDLLIDTVGGPGLGDLVECVAPGGRIVLVGYTAGTGTEIDLSRLMQRDVRLLPLNMMRREHEARAVAARLLGQLADGGLALSVTMLPLRTVCAALEMLSSGAVSGRIALAP